MKFWNAFCRYMDFPYIISLIKEMEMPRIPEVAAQAEAQESAGVASVDISVDVVDREDGARVVTMVLPARIEYTDEQLAQIERTEGSRVKAYCDISGEAICHEKNINEIKNPHRDNFDGKIISTRVLKHIMELAEV